MNLLYMHFLHVNVCVSAEQDQCLNGELVCWATLFTYELYGNHEDCFERKLPVAEVEQVFEAWSQQLKHQRIVLPTRTKVIHLWNALCCETPNQETISLYHMYMHL